MYSLLLLLHFIQVPGRLEEKWELSVIFEFSKQVETPPTNMEYIYLELSCSECSCISKRLTALDTST